ncbi:MAG: hypothetical protein LDLANPLL_01295 [Turneriella sp.]|nr:hypothetical protein [Turneriella sp.]
MAYPSAYKAVDISYILRDKGPAARLKKYTYSDDLTLRFDNRYYTIGYGAWYENTLMGFHLLELNSEGIVSRMVDADKAISADGKSHLWNFVNARMSLFNSQGAYLETKTYTNLFLPLPETMKSFRNFYIDRDSEERSIFYVYDLYQKRKELGGEYAVFLTEFFWHAGYPLICFFIVFLGGMVGGRLKKGNAATSIAVSMIFTIIYFFLMYFGTAFGESGTIHPLIAGNLANIIAAIASLSIHYRMDY